jgi:hypothetical protein
LEEEWLWIDQISIDQSNISERNRQVSQMSFIYQGTARVLAWLGKAFAGSDELFDFIARRNPDDPNFWDEASYTGIALDRVVWRELVTCEYWRWLWIYQELVLARKVYIFVGTCMVPFSHLRAYWYTGDVEHDRLKPIRENLRDALAGYARIGA